MKSEDYRSYLVECVKAAGQMIIDMADDIVGKTDAMTNLALYPELKSDTLVQSQIEVYVENNKAIKELKSSAINASVYRWWLYFGK